MTAPRITTPFGFTSTAAEVIAGVDLSGKRAIVTGASSGIGVETARALAGAGAAVTLAVRDTAAGERVAAEIRESTGNRAVTVGALDSSATCPASPRSSRAWSGPLDILVNNAGVMAIQELTLSTERPRNAVRHKSSRPFRARHRPAPMRLPRPSSARIVSVSSGGHLRSPVVFDDIDYRLPRLRPVRRLRSIEDRQRAVRRRSHPPVGATTASRSTRLMPGGIADPAAAPPASRLRPAGRGAVPTGGVAASRRSSRAPRHRCCWPLRRCWTASAAGTSRTATRPTVVRSALGARRRRRRTVCARPGQRANGCGNSR